MITAAEARSWWDNKEIMHPGMCDVRIDDWVVSLEPFRPRRKILEIGSFEGQSAIFWLRFFPEAHLTCIDHFEGTRGEHDGELWTTKLTNLEARFDRNIAEFDDRVRKLAMPSEDGLDILKEEGAQFDLVYIDGNHTFAFVEADTNAAWSFLSDGGLIIWDDCWFNEVSNAIDAFVAEHQSDCLLVHNMMVPGEFDGFVLQQKFAVKGNAGPRYRRDSMQATDPS